MLVQVGSKRLVPRSCLLWGPPRLAQCAASGPDLLLRLDRTTDGQGRVADYTLAELRRFDAGSWFGPSFTGVQISTLPEALATARDCGMGLLVEIKERQRPDVLIDRLAELLATEGWLDDVLVISFDHPSLVRAHQQIVGLRTELITHARHVDPAALATRAEAASVEWNMFTRTTPKPFTAPRLQCG